MPRPKKEQPSKRLNLTMEADDMERLEAHASTVGRPPATVAARLLAEAVKRAEQDPGADQLAEAQAKVRRLEGIILDLEQKERARRRVDEEQRPPWIRPMSTLLADEDWWNAWLPELYALLGRSLAIKDPTTRDDVPVVDQRGYADLLTFLFPPLGPTMTWRCPDYPHAARLAHDNAHRDDHQGGGRAVRAECWEPVLRHVAKALALLEQTSEAGYDPYLRLRADDEIRRGWVQTLSALIGHQDRLQPESLPTGGTRW